MNDAYDNAKDDQAALEQLVQTAVDVDREQYQSFMRERVEKTRGKGKRRQLGLVDLHLEHVRKIKRLVNRAVKDIANLERDLIRLRREEKEESR